MRKRVKLDFVAFGQTQAVSKRWLYHSFVVNLDVDPSEGRAGEGERQVSLSNEEKGELQKKKKKKKYRD